MHQTSGPFSSLLHAIRWRSGQSSAEGLPDSDSATLINDDGVTVGRRVLTGLGETLLRWEPDSVDAVVLETLGTGFNGAKMARAHAINDQGTIVGYSDKYLSPTNNVGKRATRWEPGSTAAIELAGLDGFPSGEAFDINDFGLIVGTAGTASLVNQVNRAVLWYPDGQVVDLNSLMAPDSGWVLNTARAVTNSGWIAGLGMFDSDGPGGRAAYSRMYLMQLPEPWSGSLIAVAATMLLVRGRRSCFPRQ